MKITFFIKFTTVKILCLYYESTSSFAIKKSRCDFDDKLKVGDVRYKHLTQITIKVQLFWRLPYEM